MSKNQQLIEILKQSITTNNIANELYHQYDVKKGLRNENKTGVLVGLTRICDVVGYQIIENKKVDCEGELYYRGIEISDIIKHRSFKVGTYEEVCFLLLFGKLPNQDEYQTFVDSLHSNYLLPKKYIDLNLMQFPAQNLMNKIQTALLGLYHYDQNPDDPSVENTLIQGLNILAKMPAIIVYSYYNKINYYQHKPLFLNSIDQTLSIAESILHLLRPDGLYQTSEVELLDILLCLHADHGGGNNSTFANLVISSTETDLYSALAGAVGSLKGPRHGGANEKVTGMLELAINDLGTTPSDQAIIEFIDNILAKKIYDQSGLLYGFGHAVYTISDPRAIILKQYISLLETDSTFQTKLTFYLRFEQVACEYMAAKKDTSFGVNVDYYSGLAYEILQIPTDLILPLFASSRVVGWLAHNIENKLYSDKIIRPATKYIGELNNYIPMKDRQ